MSDEPTIKPVTKTALSAFIQRNSPLTLAQSKLLADRLRQEFNLTDSHTLEPGGATIKINQLWRHKDSDKVRRITNIQMGPLYRPGDSVTPWVPEKIFWEDAEDPGITGSLAVIHWRTHFTPVVEAVEPDPTPRLYALVSKDGTAMSETVLPADEFTDANKQRVMANAPADWNGGDFHDVSGNAALNGDEPA